MPDPFAVFDVLVATSVLGFLAAPDVPPIAPVCRRWSVAASDEGVWGQWLRRDFGLEQVVGLDAEGRLLEGGPAKAAWKSWWQLGQRLGLRRVEAPLYMRVLAMWTKLEQWTLCHKRSIYDSLRPGASKAQFAALEEETGKPVPDMVRMVWGVHDGQGLLFDDALDRGDREGMRQHRAQACDGLFGGYSYYSHFACSCMFPIAKVAMFHARVGHTYPDRIIFAGSRNNAKLFFLTLSNGAVSVTDLRVPCVPPGEHALLRWLEEYARRLTDGVYQLGHLAPGVPDSLGVSLFPQSGPLVSVRVSHGIEATASAIFLPEDPHSRFTYSVRLRVPSAEAFPFQRAQLATRHWQIVDGAGHTEEVSGEGVIGKFPVLHSGGFRDDEQGYTGEEVEGTFVYQSCTGPLRNIPPGTGSFGGHLVFIPGTLDQPVAASFPVEVGAIPLALPDFIY